MFSMALTNACILPCANVDLLERRRLYLKVQIAPLLNVLGASSPTHPQDELGPRALELLDYRIQLGHSYTPIL